MKRIGHSRRIVLSLVTALAVLTLGATAAVAQQASITLLNCNNALCNANDTAWTLEKVPDSQTFTAVGTSTITWSVTATKGATTDNFLTVNGFITVKNTGTAPATIGNIVVNLQKPRTGANTGPCRNVPWVSAAADVATANSGDAATVANIVAAASTEVQACNAAQGANNYVLSSPKGTFTETTGSGTLEFTDVDNNTAFSLTPQPTLAVGASINLLYKATFNNTVLGLAAGSSVRAEVIVTFGNSGPRGGSGSSASNIDISGDGVINTDEALVRSVPCRVTNAVPALLNGNSIVTLSDKSTDVSLLNATNVALSNFSTDIGGGDGDEDISATTVRSVSVDETCTPPGSATVNNVAHLDGASTSIIVQGPQTGTDPVTGLPIYQTFEFSCVVGVALDDGANANVACEQELPDTPEACTYSQGGYAGSGAPGQIFNNNFATTFPGGLTIGINDGLGPLHHALWTAAPPGPANLKTYLAGGGPSGALTADSSNATSASGGALGKQTAALTLNIGFDAAGVLPNGAQGLAGLKLCNLVDGSVIGTFALNAAQAAALNGQSVADVLADANDALGGNGLPTYVGSFGNLNAIVEALNLSFHECVASAFAINNLCQ